MKLDRETYPDKDVIQAMGQFVPLKQNVDKEDTKKFATKYKVQSIPDLLVLDENGKVLKNFVGFQSAKAMTAWIDEGLKAYKAEKASNAHQHSKRKAS